MSKFLDEQGLAVVGEAIDAAKEADVEFVTYSSGVTLTPAQIEKAKKGKLYIYNSGSELSAYFNHINTSSELVFFEINKAAETTGTNFPFTNRVASARFKVNPTTGAISRSVYNDDSVSDSENNVFSAATAPTSNGKKLVREQNIYGKLVPSYAAGDANKVLSVNSQGDGIGWQAAGGSVVAYEGTSALPSDVVFESWTLHRAIKDGNILWVVLSGIIKNGGENTANYTHIFDFVLPSELSSKIYRQDGTSCDGALDTDNLIVHYTGSNANQYQVYVLRSTTANNFALYFAGQQSHTPSTKLRVDVRIPLFLDIGTVQA